MSEGHGNFSQDDSYDDYADRPYPPNYSVHRLSQNRPPPVSIPEPSSSHGMHMPTPQYQHQSLAVSPGGFHAAIDYVDYPQASGYSPPPLPPRHARHPSEGRPDNWQYAPQPSTTRTTAPPLMPMPMPMPMPVYPPHQYPPSYGDQAYYSAQSQAPYPPRHQHHQPRPSMGVYPPKSYPPQQPQQYPPNTYYDNYSPYPDIPQSAGYMSPRPQRYPSISRASARPYPMPMPTRHPQQQTFEKPTSYPALESFRPPSQDYFSKFRSSTVQPSSAAAAEELHRASIRKSLHRENSGRYNMSSSDESDNEDDGYLARKPLPPPPPAAPPPPGADEEEEEEQQQEQGEQDVATEDESTDAALMSVLSKVFVERIKDLANVRELASTDKHSHLFTGREAVDIVREILWFHYPREFCLRIVESLMRCRPGGLFVPIEGSQVSRKPEMVYDSPDQIYALTERKTTGVITSITKCYVYDCVPGRGGCYAPRCPNNPKVFETDIEHASDVSRSISMRTKTGNIEDLQSREAFRLWVTKEFYEELDKRERDRQEAINEIIYGEELYFRDLDMMHEAIVLPLQESDVIPSAERELFIDSIFRNYKELRELSVQLFDDLLERQKEHENECVPGIGDILVKHFNSDFKSAFGIYIHNVYLAEYQVAHTSRVNRNFGRFIDSIEKDERTKQGFRHYLLRPVIRVQRYSLLVNAILKKTDQDDPDYENLKEAFKLVEDIAAYCDQLSESTKNRVEILKLNDSLTCRQGESYDLKLNDPNRRIYFRSKLRKLESSTQIDVIVLDHIVLLTKPRQVRDGTEHLIWRRPIPLQMLYVREMPNTFDLPSLQASYGTAYATVTNLRHSGSFRGGNPYITFVHPGRHGGHYPLLCESRDQKNSLLAAIKRARADIDMQTDAFELNSLEGSYFQTLTVSTDMDTHGRVNCTVPFEGANHQRKIAIGTSTGVFFKTLGSGRPRLVIALKDVTQIGVIEKNQLLIVLTDGELEVYPLDLLESPINTIAPDRLKQCIAKRVSFFQIGVCSGEELLIYAQLRTASTAFTALRPVREPGDKHSHRHRHTSLRDRLLHNGHSSTWFEQYKEFLVGAKASHVHFLKSKFAVVCERGFEIIDPNNLSCSHSIPNVDDPNFNFLQTRADGLRPLAMYRVHNKFLLCYNKFTFFVNNNTQALMPRDDKSAYLCEWETNPDHIVYRHPYIIAIEQRFIEIRHVESGDLVQIISGNDCRLTYYCPNPNVIQGCIVHNRQKSYQDVFELVAH